MQTSFYDYLDDLPDSLYEAVVTHPCGDLQQRCEAVLYWRSSLLKGQLPRLFSWPGEPQYLSIIHALESSRKYRLCLNNEPLCDYYCIQILQFIADKRDELILLMPGEDEETPPEIPSSPDASESDSQQDDSSTESESTRSGEPSTVSPEQNAVGEAETGQAEESARESMDDIETEMDAKMDMDQGPEMEQLLKDFAIERRLGFDLSQGLARRQQWKDILRCHKTIKASPWLQNIIRQVGRGREVAAKQAEGRPFFPEEHSRQRQLSSHRTTRAPMEMRGVERNDDVGRMLPSELSMLGHKKLKMLWHLRRAEGMLLSYEVDGVLSEHIPVCEPMDLDEVKQSPLRHRQQGPVIMILDTSASMRGDPEHLAKAMVLETVRVCRQQQRGCYLFLFSGPGNISHAVLDGSRESWLHILELMQFSFHGGTQVEAVMSEALQLLQEKAWRQADILLLSDGRFSVADSLMAKIREARQQTGMACFGVHLGSWKKHAMHELCDRVYDYAQLSA